jgi:hypothetical protein
VNWRSALNFFRTERSISIEQVKLIDVKPGQWLILRTPRQLSKQEAQQLRTSLEPWAAAHGVRVAIIGEGFELETGLPR